MAATSGPDPKANARPVERAPRISFRQFAPLFVLGSEGWPVYAGLVALGVATALLESIGLGVISLFLVNLVADRALLTNGGYLGQALQSLHSVIGENNVVIFALLLALMMLRSIMIFAYTYLSERKRYQTYQRFREVIFENYLAAAYAHAIRTRSGVVNNTIQHESWQAAEAVWTACRALVSLCITAVFIVVMVAVSWHLALIAGVGGFLLFLSTRAIQSGLRKLGETVLSHQETLSGYLVAALSGLRTLKAYDADGAFVRRYRDLLSVLSRLFNRSAILSSALRPVSDLLAFFIVSAIAFGAIAFGASVVEIVAYVAILVRLQPIVHGLAQQMTALSQLRVAYDAVVGVERELAAHRELEDDNALPIVEIGQKITIDNVTFSYEGQMRPALRNVTLHIPRGETVAITGGSGAGKTTIISLLLRLLEPDEGGEIRIGEGVLLSSVRRRDWLALTGVAGQDMELIEGTLIDCLAIAAPGITREEALEALALAGAEDILAALPQGLDTQLGARGGYLSGGQRQRVLLAAALARNPQLLLLDEATNAIDARMEAEVLRNIRQARPDLTIVVIAHRGSAIAAADRTVVLHQGEVIDAGSAESAQGA